jgi:hypothetical protein
MSSSSLLPVATNTPGKPKHLLGNNKQQENGSRQQQYQEHCAVMNRRSTTSASNNNNNNSSNDCSKENNDVVTQVPKAPVVPEVVVPEEEPEQEQFSLPYQAASPVVLLNTDMTLTALEEQPSYDYYMEYNNHNNNNTYNNTNRSVGGNTFDGTNGNDGNDGNDTFENLWQDEEGDDDDDDDDNSTCIYTDYADTGTLATTTTATIAVVDAGSVNANVNEGGLDGSKNSGRSSVWSLRQKKNWKAKAITALLEQQIKEAQQAKFKFGQQQQQQHTGPSTPMVGDVGALSWFSPQPADSNEHGTTTNNTTNNNNASGSNSQSSLLLPSNGGTVPETSGSGVPANSSTPQNLSIPSTSHARSFHHPSPPSITNSENDTIMDDIASSGRPVYSSSRPPKPQSRSKNPIMIPTNTAAKNNNSNNTNNNSSSSSSSNNNNKSNKNHKTQAQIPLEQQFQVIHRSKSLPPPDPPSHKFSSRLMEIPRATPGNDYYDPDDEDDALTNLVITVVGLEGQEDGADNDSLPNNSSHRGRKLTKLLPPSFGNVDDDEEDDDEEDAPLFGDDYPAATHHDGPVAIGDTSHYSTTSTMSHSQNKVSFQTLFLMADATSGILFGALVILLVPLVLFGMLMYDLLNVEVSPIAQWREFMGIPMNEEITWPVRVTQLCLLLGWILLVHQAALVHATLQLCLSMCRRRTKRTTCRGTNHDNSFSNTNSGVVTMSSTEHGAAVSKTRWMLVTFLEWLKQLGYMVTAVVVLLQATVGVQTLLWNMATLEFVLRLDALAFLVWSRMGIARQLMDKATSPTTHIDPIYTPLTEDSDESAIKNTIAPAHANISNNSNSNSNSYSQSNASNVPFNSSSSAERKARSNSRLHRHRGRHGRQGNLNKHYSLPPLHSTDYPMIRTSLYLLISTTVLFAYVVVVYQQVMGYPVESPCRAIAIQFGDVTPDDNDEMHGDSFFYPSILGGIYTQRQGRFNRYHGRYIYDIVVDPLREQVSPGDMAPFKLVYCRPLQAWTVSLGSADPCKDYLLRTSSTMAYDLMSLDSNSVTWNAVSQRGHVLPLDVVHTACTDCVQAQGRARSSPSYGYHCVAHHVDSMYQDQVTGLSNTTILPSTPCANLTWDRRHSPFPDSIWQPSDSEDFFNDEAPSVAAGVDSILAIVVDAQDKMLQEPHFQRPVYWSQFNAQLVLLVFLGRRWAVIQLRKDLVSSWRAHPERHVERLSSLWSEFSGHGKSIEESTGMEDTNAGPEFVPIFLSEPVALDFRVANEVTPDGLHWYKVQPHGIKSSLGASLTVGSLVDTVLNCAVCNDVSNPCHSGGFCLSDKQIHAGASHLGGRCVCRRGYEGFLCESTSIGCRPGDSQVGLCFNNGTCGTDGECDCPRWMRNKRSFPIRGDVCQYLPDCWEFEDDGLACFEKGTCNNVGCDNGARCNLDGTCDCEASSSSTSTDPYKYRGKLCQEQVNCYDYEADGMACVEKGTCSNAFCNGGVCSADGSCRECPILAIGRFCQVLPDCFEFEIGGASTECFSKRRCTNLGCTNGGICRPDGSCSCKEPESTNSASLNENIDVDPFTDDDTLATAANSDRGHTRFSGKLCQISQRDDSGALTTDNNVVVLGSTDCILSSCETNGGNCTSEGVCKCPLGLSGDECEIILDCFELEADEQECFGLGTCTSRACQHKSDNSSCQADGQCSCQEMHDVELYGKLCHKVRAIDDCYAAEEEGEDCLKRGTCTNIGCLNGGTCTADGSCDCPLLFWGKQCQHARNCFDQEYSCFFNTFLTGTEENNATISPCSDAGCLNNGICQASGTCLCPGGYTGKICQEVQT